MDTFKSLLGTRLKQLRKTRKMNQAQLAESAGVEVNTISRYETGGIAPSIEQLLKLAKALNVSPMEILPPQDPALQQLMSLRISLAEKAQQINSPDILKELISIAENHLLQSK